MERERRIEKLERMKTSARSDFQVNFLIKSYNFSTHMNTESLIRGQINETDSR